MRPAILAAITTSTATAKRPSAPQQHQTQLELLVAVILGSSSRGSMTGASMSGSVLGSM